MYIEVHKTDILTNISVLCYNISEYWGQWTLVYYFYPMYNVYYNISSVVEFQRWWVLKRKIFAQESTCSKKILIPTTLNYLWFSVFGVVKVDHFDFPWEILEILCELDVKVLHVRTIQSTLKTVIFSNYWGL